MDSVAHRSEACDPDRGLSTRYKPTPNSRLPGIDPIHDSGALPTCNRVPEDPADLVEYGYGVSPCADYRHGP